jgi:hypothetical protein
MNPGIPLEHTFVVSARPKVSDEVRCNLHSHSSLDYFALIFQVILMILAGYKVNYLGKADEVRSILPPANPEIYHVVDKSVFYACCLQLIGFLPATTTWSSWIERGTSPPHVLVDPIERLPRH